MLRFKPGQLPAEFPKKDEESSLTCESTSEVTRLIVVLKFKPGRLPYFL